MVFFLVESGIIEKIRNIEIIAWTTLIFGILLYISDKFKLEKNIKNNFNFKSAIFIGFFQILSLIPGVSRSGIAITAARFLNFKRVDAAKISFLLSIPILGCCFNFWIKKYINFQKYNFTLIKFIFNFFSFLFSFYNNKIFFKIYK